MKRLFILLLLCAPLMAQNKGPKITFDELEHNYGKVNQFTEVTHSFRFTNTGDEDLIIKDIESG